MKKQNKGVRGAVSVFLVMILVPCIVVSSVFVDLGRVHMSKSMTTSASDLALNSLLTNYDSDLNEWYGMIASCQNIDEFYEASAQFFLRTISSQGLSDDEIILLSDYYANATNDDTIYDLLQIECQTAPSDMIKPVANANLSNPTLVKDQIVEFMKYRAPIEISTDLISKFMDSNGNKTSDAGAILESDQNDELVEAKQDFYESESDLLKAAYKSYLAIYDYYADAKNVPLNNAKLVEYVNMINNIKTIYAYVHNASVKNLSNTANLSVYTRVTMSLSKYHTTYPYTHNSVYSSKKTEDGVTTYYISGTRINSLLTDLEEAIEDFETKKTEFENAGKTLMNTLPGTGDYEANPMQWWVQMDAALHGSTNRTTRYKTSAEEMLKAYSKVLSIEDCTLESEGIPSDWTERFDDLTTKVDNLHRKYLQSDIEASNDTYLAIVNKLEYVSSTYINNKNSSAVWVNVNGQSKTVDQWITYSSTELSSLRSSLQARVDELNLAINGRGKDGDDNYIPSLDTLKTLASTYNSNLGTWSDIADDKSTSMQQSDYDEIYGGNGKPGLQLEQKITSASVTELKTRLINIRDQLQTLINAIDSLQYGNKKITEITSFSTFKSQMNSKVKSSDIPLKNKDIDTYAGTTFGQLIKPTSSNVVTLSNTNNNDYNPDINPNDNGTVDTPELFKYFHEKFEDVDEDEFKEAEEDEKKAEEAQKNYQDEQLTAASKYRGEGTNIPITFSSSDSSYSAGTKFIESLAGLINDVIDGNYDGIRDDIYVTTYITKMFSYATYDREVKYSLLTDAQKEALTPTNSGVYSSEEIVGAADKEKTFLSEKMTDSYNKSLTNKMINKTNNAAYLAEIEYILYGQNTNQANLKKAFGDIYAFRFVLNSVSSFQHFWSNTTINGVAASISAMFGGIVPVPAIKVVLLPLLAAVETCMDNSRLSYGMPVELYKSQASDWWIAPPSGASSFSAFFSSLSGGGASGKNQDKGFFYSDYLMIFVYTGLSGGGDLEANMYKRIAEVIQTNIGKKIGENSGYSLQKSIVYFELTATVRVKPLMITLPIFNDYSNNMDTKTDWCTYTIKTTRGYS